MSHKDQSVSKYVARFSAVLVVAVGASACSSVPNWADPTGWIGGGDDQTASQPDDQNTQTADNTPADSTQKIDNGQSADNAQTADNAGLKAGTLPEDNAQTSDNTKTADNAGLKAGTQSTDNTQTADNAQTPDLAAIPDKPTTQSTPDDQKQVAQSLASDRAKAQYSGDALKGGTEAAAAPPPSEPAPQTEELANDNPQPARAHAQQTETAQAAVPAAQPAPQTQMASAAPPAVPATSTYAAPSTAGSGVPAVPAVGPQMAQSDSALGFRPSAAPPLDPSVAQFVPASILARYKQTASIGAPAAVPNGPMPTPSDSSNGMSGIVVGQNLVGQDKPRKTTKVAMGGPEKMSGAVVANFESIDPSGMALPAAYATNSVGPAAMVFFPHDTTILNAQARAQVRAAAQSFLAHGGLGFVKVVGHSSSQTASSAMANHLVRNFERSQARANSVARALIAQGVPANKVLIEAAGDDQSNYSMPQGEDGSHRADIFFQS